MRELSPIKTIRIGKKSFKIVLTELKTSKERAKIPTTFLPLSPDKIPFQQGSADVLCGLFHIMWADMPKPTTYELRLADLFSSSGEYQGSRLECAYPKKISFF